MKSIERRRIDGQSENPAFAGADRRIALSRPSRSDCEAMYHNWATDEQTTKYLSWKAYTDIGKLREYLKTCISSYENPEYYHWVIEYETINLHDISNRSQHAELGYCIGSKWWNRGIVTKAAKAVIDFAFTELNANKICALHDTQNIASGRVMQKCGMTLEGILREHSYRKDETFDDTAVYGILKKEWKTDHLTHPAVGIKAWPKSAEQNKYFPVFMSLDSGSLHTVYC